MKKILILFNCIIFIIYMFSYRCLVHASETVAKLIGGQIEDYYYLSDNHNEDRFILYCFKNHGYLIYDTASNVIVEYSLRNESPYVNMEGEYYYFGPTMYFSECRNRVLDAQNGVINLEDYQDISKIVTKQPSSSTSRSSAEYRVPYSYYFEKLDGVINDFPENVGGDCGYVAASILLSYYDLFYNSNIIADEYITPAVNNTFLEDEWEYYPCANLEFKNLLRTYGHSNKTVASDILSVIDSYFILNTDILDYYTSVHTAPIGYSTICSNIYQDGPMIIFGLLTLDQIIFHAFIAYGYNQISITEMMLLTHLGHENRSEVWINMSLLGNFNLYGTTYAIDFSDVEHQHGDTFKVNGHSYCISESLHLDDYVEVYDYESHTHHKVSCECGKIVRYEEHNFIPYLTKGVHPLVAPITNSICSKCGYIKSVFPNI